VTQLNSGAVVASVENHSPVSTVSVFLRGGASANNFPGASSVFKTYVQEGFSTPNHTGMHLIRLGEAAGINLEVESDREVLAYHGEANRDNIHHLFLLLSEMTSNNQYRSYECPIPVAWPDSVTAGPRHHGRLQAVQKAMSVQARVEDLVHKAAYRSQPLGNSDVIPDYMYPKLSAELVNDFVSATHGESGVVVVGAGVDHAMLIEGAATFGLKSGGVATPAEATSKYLGGDARFDAGGDTAHVIIAGQACSFASRDRLATAVAAELLNNAAVVANGGGVSVLNIDAPTKGFTAHYKLTGLLGVSLAAPAADAAAVCGSVASFLRSYTPSVEDLALGKRTAMMKLADADTSLLGAQLLHAGEVTDDVAGVAAVTAADVAKVFATAFGGKLSVGAYGNIENVPYSDTL